MQKYYRINRMKDIFENIYITNQWKSNYGTQSGPGSSIECSYEYLLFLDKFVKENKIKTILDLGCGDFNLMKHFNFDQLDYVGVDIVSHVIESNNKNYIKSNIKFLEYDITQYTSTYIFDLVILKDVLQHLSNDNILKILKNINFSKNIIFVNDYCEENVDSTNGGYRPINLNNYPFNLNCKKLFEYNSCGFIKHVNLLTF